jgi:hypothetical protein
MKTLKNSLLVFILLLFLVLPGKGIGQTSIHHWESVVLAEEIWTYFVGTAEPDAQWRTQTFNDTGWEQGPGGIWYGDGDDNTVIDAALSLYMRIHFTILDMDKIEQAVLHVDYDDAFVAYINNIEVARANIGSVGDHPACDQPADDEHEAVISVKGIPESFDIDRELIESCIREGENVLALQVHNSSIESSDMSSTTFLSVGINDTSWSYYLTPDWFFDVTTLTSNLPIIAIDTDGAVIPNNNRIAVHMGIVDNGPGTRNSIQDTFYGYDGRISIELRGNTSLDFPKKSYAFETQDDDGENNNVSLLDMPTENDWILYAPYSDKSLMRNTLTFDLARDIGRYAPRCKFCELIINGDYRGIYVLMEKIKRDNDRIDIAGLTPADTAGDALTGGYVLKLDWEDYKSNGWYSPIDGTLFHYHHPQKSDLLPVQRDYIKQWIIAFEYALAGDDFLDPQTGYRNYIDIGSFVDYFMSVELAHNADSYRISTYMYKERDSQGGLLSFGPLWDFNLAYGNQDEGPFGSHRRWSWEIGLDDINFWWEQFLHDSVFVDQIQTRWAELRTSFFSTDYIHQAIDSMALYLDEAKERNFTRWPVLGEWVWPNAFVGETYEEEVEYLKIFIVNRLDWVDEHIPDLGFEPTIPDTVEDEEPITRYLINAYPNPFQSDISVQVYIAFDRPVRIDIYNVLGKKIKTLVDGQYEADTHTFPWDGRDGDGLPVTDGLYLAVVKINYERRATLKLVKY